MCEWMNKVEVEVEVAMYMFAVWINSNYVITICHLKSLHYDAQYNYWANVSSNWSASKVVL